MADDKEEKKDDAPIIVKKIVKGGGHHGGAWKVAYADFVTAMMAFFLLLWLLNVSTDEELKALAGQFQPDILTVSEAQSGAGGLFGGNSMSPDGSMDTTVQPVAPPREDPRKIEYDNKKSDLERAKEELRKQEEERMEQAAEQLRQEIQNDPELRELAENLLIDMTPEGLRIQVVDKDGKAMFASGSAKMFELTRTLMMKVGKAIQNMPNELSIRGHTDSVGYGAGAEYTNWELSADRANASRRVLEDSGITAQRLNNVVGKADTEPLLPDNTEDARNRRISIILLKEELTDPNFDKKAEALSKDENFKAQIEKEDQDAATQQPQRQSPPPAGSFRRTPGKVEFP